MFEEALKIIIDTRIITLYADTKGFIHKRLTNYSRITNLKRSNNVRNLKLLRRPPLTTNILLTTQYYVGNYNAETTLK